MVLQPVWEATSGDSESLFCSSIGTHHFASIHLKLNDLNSPDGTVRTLFLYLFSHKTNISFQSFKLRPFHRRVLKNFLKYIVGNFFPIIRRH